MRFSLLLAGVLLAAPTAVADDWPQWRGPNRDEISKETGLNTDWKAHKPKLLWTFKDAGAGYTAPAIVGNTLYDLGAADGKDFAFAVDVASGERKWKQELGPVGKRDRGDGPRGTPTVAEGALYFIRADGDLHCLDAATGTPRWQKALNGEIMNLKWGYSESPLVDGDLVVCTPGGSNGTMAAFDKKTGQLVWRSKELKDRAGYSSPIVAEVQGVKQYIQLTASGIAGVAAKDGKLLWHYVRDGYTIAVIPTAIFFDEHVYATAGYGAGCDLIKLTKDGELFKAEKVYRNKNMINHHGGVLLSGGYIYGFSDGRGWVCQNVETGENAWEEKNKNHGKGSLTCAAGHLFCYDETTGVLTCAEATPKAWKETGRLELPEKSKIKTNDNKFWTHPVIANGKLYLRHQDLLFCFELKDSVAAK